MNKPPQEEEMQEGKVVAWGGLTQLKKKKKEREKQKARKKG